MSIVTTTNKISYSGDGSQKIFPFNFALLLSTDLQVILIDADGTEHLQVLGGQYTMTKSGVDFSGGGNVVMVVAPVSTQTLVLVRVMPLTQDMDYEEGDSFPAEEHERALDKLTMIGQQLGEKIDRQIAAPIVDVDPQMELPNAAVRANMYPHFDANGDLEVVSGIGTAVSAAMGPVVAASTLDEARRQFGFANSRMSLKTWGANSGWELPKGTPVGIYKDKYVWPLWPDDQNSGFSPTGWGSVSGETRRSHVETVVSDTDKSYPATRNLWLLVQRTTTSGFGAVLGNIAPDFTMTQKGSGVESGTTNVATHTADGTIALIKCSNTLWCLAYVSTTGTLRCIAITLSGTTLAFSGDYEINSGTTWNKIQGMSFTGLGISNNVHAGVVGSKSSGSDALTCYTLKWSGSAWSVVHTAAGGLTQTRLLWEVAEEPYYYHAGTARYAQWMGICYDPTSYAGAAQVWIFAPYANLSDLDGGIAMGGGVGVYLSSTAGEIQRVGMAKMGAQQSCRWCAFIDKQEEKGTYDSRYVYMGIVTQDMWDWTNPEVRGWIKYSSSTGTSFEHLNTMGQRVNGSMCGFHVLGNDAYGGLFSEDAMYLFTCRNELPLFVGWVYINSAKFNGEGYFLMHSYRNNLCPDYIGVAAESRLMNWSNIEVVLFGGVEGISGSFQPGMILAAPYWHQEAWGETSVEMQYCMGGVPVGKAVASDAIFVGT